MKITDANASFQDTLQKGENPIYLQVAILDSVVSEVTKIIRPFLNIFLKTIGPMNFNLGIQLIITMEDKTLLILR